MHNSGRTIPVDALPPKTMAMMVMFIMSMPFTPAFERPMIKAAAAIRTQLRSDPSGKPLIGTNVSFQTKILGAYLIHCVTMIYFTLTLLENIHSLAALTAVLRILRYY